MRTQDDNTNQMVAVAMVFFSRSAASGRINEPRIPHRRALAVAGLGSCDAAWAAPHVCESGRVGGDAAPQWPHKSWGTNLAGAGADLHQSSARTASRVAMANMRPGFWPRRASIFPRSKRHKNKGYACEVLPDLSSHAGLRLKPITPDGGQNSEYSTSRGRSTRTVVRTTVP